MIPGDYTCAACGAHGVKLWRESNTFGPIALACAACRAAAGHPVDLSRHDQSGWCVPAVPTLDGSWWGYSSVPAEGVAWWKALPLALSGEWPVRGGVERWLPYRAAMDATMARGAELLRVGFDREGGAVALVFVASAVEADPGPTTERERLRAIFRRYLAAVARYDAILAEDRIDDAALAAEAAAEAEVLAIGRELLGEADPPAPAD